MALEYKYAEPLKSLDKNLAKAQNDFANLVSDLTGDPYTLEGLRGLINPSNN